MTPSAPFLSTNERAECQGQELREHHSHAQAALEKTADVTPNATYQVGDQVWLEAKHLALPYATVTDTDSWTGLWTDYYTGFACALVLTTYVSSSLTRL